MCIIINPKPGAKNLWHGSDKIWLKVEFEVFLLDGLLLLRPESPMYSTILHVAVSILMKQIIEIEETGWMHYFLPIL